MKWYLIDDCTSSKAQMFVCPLTDGDKAKALQLANAVWSTLRAYDKKRRDAFYICLGEIDADGCFNFETMTDVTYIKEV